MHTAPLSGENRLFGGARSGPSARLGVIGAAIGSSAVGIWLGVPSVVLLGLAVVADLARPHRVAGWQARSLPFLVAAAFGAPIPSLTVAFGLAAYRASGAPRNAALEASKWGVVEALALGLGTLAAKALVAEQEGGGPATRLRCLVLDDPSAICLGNEPVRVDGVARGRVTSGGYGHRVEASIAYAHLPATTVPGDRVEIGIFDTWLGAGVAPEPLYDPAGDRIRGVGAVAA